MKRYTVKNTRITEYNSLSEFLSDINSLPNNQFFKDRHSSQTTANKYDTYYGTANYQEAADLMSHGWDAAAGKMATKVKLTNATSTAVRSSKPSYGVVGSQASVPRYLQGIPTNMVSRQMTYAKQKVVTITKGITYSSWWKPEEIMNECIKALQIIQSMENGGQRVRLNVMFAIYGVNRNHSSICKVCIKQPDERLNLSKMAFALAHPSMLRRFFLKWVEVDPFAEGDMGWGYGKPGDDSLKNKAMAENEYYIPEEIKDMDALIATLTGSAKNPGGAKR